MGWLIAVACLLLVGVIPLGIIARYDNGDANVWITAGALRFSVYPASKHSAGKKRKTSKIDSNSKAKNSDKGFGDLLPRVQLVLEFLMDFRRRLRINELQFQATLASDDPCDLSVHYGWAWAAIGNVMPLLERCFTIKNRKIEVLCDYTAEKTKLYGYINMTITVSQLLSIGAYHGIKLLRKYMFITKKAKDGAVS